MNRILKHVFFWLAYLLFQAYIEFIWIKSSYEHLSAFSRLIIALEVELLLLFPKMVFTYMSTYLLLSYKKNRNIYQLFFRGLFTISISILVYRLIAIYVVLPYIYHEVDKDPFSIMRILTTSIEIITVTGIFQVIKLLNIQLKTEHQEQQLVRSKLEAELSYLKSQTNPHFLFNTLNNIYGLSKKNPALSSEIILKLSKLLRFMIYGTRKPLLLIEEEIDLIENYIEIEKLRYSNKLALDFSFENEASEVYITPLILLPLVENAFKHGVAESTNDAFIFIHCKINEQKELSFLVKNSKEIQEKIEGHEGIGLSNIKRQLQLLYKKHHLEINETDTEFELKLYISLDSYEQI